MPNPSSKTLKITLDKCDCEARGITNGHNLKNGYEKLTPCELRAILTVGVSVLTQQSATEAGLLAVVCAEGVKALVAEFDMMDKGGKA